MLKKFKIAIVALLALGTFSLSAADTVPAQYTDAEFWRFINEWSEPGGSFQYENFVSNETALQWVIPKLVRRVPPGGVYIGVAPDQNFTLEVHINPKGQLLTNKPD